MEIESDKNGIYNNNNNNTNGANINATKYTAYFESKYSSSIIFLDNFTEVPCFNLVANREKPGSWDGAPKDSRIAGMLGNDVTKVMGVADDKINLYLERFELIRERMLKSPKYIFQHQMAEKRADEYSIPVINIGSLLGSQGPKYIVGVIVEIEQGTCYMQDYHSRVKLDLKNTEKSQGFILEFNVVVAYGVFMDTVFKVEKIMLPDVFTGISSSNEVVDKFGTKTKLNNALSKLVNLETELISEAGISDSKKRQKNNTSIARQKALGLYDTQLLGLYPKVAAENSCIVILSDFNLEYPQTLQRFEELLEGMRALDPFMFILQGSFFKEKSFDGFKEKSLYDQSIEQLLGIFKRNKDITDKAFWLMVPCKLFF
jgi:hypothetical protein